MTEKFRHMIFRFDGPSVQGENMGNAKATPQKIS
jgi:hypothetical protein